MRDPDLSGTLDFRLVAVAGGALAVMIGAGLLILIVVRLILVALGGPPDVRVTDTQAENTRARPERADTSILRRTTPFRPQESRNTASLATPPTSLALVLHGIREQIGGGGAAIISDASGKQRLYISGERIGDTAQVVEIRKDSVVLSRAGHLETLHMVRGNARADDQRFNIRAVTLDRSLARRALMQLGLGRAQQHDGKIAVYPPLNEPVFERLGIVRGDIVTSIGGVRIDGQTDLAGLVGQNTSDRLRIDLERRGRKHRLLLRMTDDGER